MMHIRCGVPIYMQCDAFSRHPHQRIYFVNNIMKTATIIIHKTSTVHNIFVKHNLYKTELNPQSVGISFKRSV